MHNIYLRKEDGFEEPFKEGFVVLTGRGGHTYKNKALYIKGYGWVPCSKKLCNDFSNNPKDLVLVLSDSDDDKPTFTSDIWVTRTTVLDWDDL